MRHKVFLSHNSADKLDVEALALRLRDEVDIEPWLDIWNLIPGAPWQEELEQAIAQCDVCAIFIGKAGLGAWHHEEIRSLISRRVSTRDLTFRVIPVLLPGAERAARSSLPGFLVATTWVEFRHSLDDPDAFRRLLCGIRGEPPLPPVSRSVQIAECPFRGLEFFDVEHSDRFFGREAVTQWLVDDTRKSVRPGNDLPRFLAILGASGSGKSSLARAGLYASLRAGAIEGSRDWLYVPPLRPESNPLESLELALLKAAAGSPHFEAVRHELLELREKPDRLHRAARLLVSDGSAPRRLFLLVDQFEEVFTKCNKDELRQPFIAALLHAVREQAGPVIVCLTIRADFYPKLAEYAELARVVDQHQYLIGSMSEAELRLAVEQPAILAGAEFESGLVDTLLDDVRRQPGALPLLQHALKELWKGRQNGRRLTHAAYNAMGKLEGALERRANEVYSEFSVEDQELCRLAFLRLVHLGEGLLNTRRRVQIRELLAIGDTSRMEMLIRRLADADVRLVVTDVGDTDHPDGSVEVTHEVLIHSWSRLRKWLEADRASLRTQRRLTDAAREWSEEGRKSDLLYHGGRLGLAQEWAARHGAEMTCLEKEFLSASSQRQQDANAKALSDEKERAATLERLAAEQARATALEHLRAEAAEQLARAEQEKSRKATTHAQELRSSNSRIIKQKKRLVLYLLTSVLLLIISGLAMHQAYVKSAEREEAFTKLRNSEQKLRRSAQFRFIQSQLSESPVIDRTFASPDETRILSIAKDGRVIMTSWSGNNFEGVDLTSVSKPQIQQYLSDNSSPLPGTNTIQATSCTFSSGGEIAGLWNETGALMFVALESQEVVSTHTYPLPIKDMHFTRHSGTSTALLIFKDATVMEVDVATTRPLGQGVSLPAGAIAIEYLGNGRFRFVGEDGGLVSVEIPK